jgi:hypothetical protein
MKQLALCIVLLTISACTKPVGSLTVLNSDDKPMKGTFGGEPFSVRPGKAWTVRDIEQGEHELVLGESPLSFTITENRTTFVDPSAAACYVVADYRKQYGKKPGKDVIIVQRFEKKKVFTPRQELRVDFGRKLPQKIPEGTHARRLHVVDCAMVKNKKKISESLARLP